MQVVKIYHICRLFINYFVFSNICFSYIDYRVGLYRVRYSGTGGVSGKIGSGYLWNPTTSYSYIGVNRMYATPSAAGSGVCRIYCGTSTSLGSPSAADEEVVGNATSTA